MIGVPVGHRAVGLPWLPPSTDALLALAADPPDSRAIARDPAMLVHVLRFARPTADCEHFALTPTLLSQPSLCSNAAAFVQRGSQAPSHLPSPDAIDRIAELAAGVAADLAGQYGYCTPTVAAITARIAPLGWYATRAIEPSEIIACLDDPDFAEEPERVQRGRWGLSASALTRRLAARWRLPPWLVATVGFLRLDVRDAVAAGAPEGLFQIVQSAYAATERTLGTLGLTDARLVDVRHAMTADAVSFADAAASRPRSEPVKSPVEPVPLLERLLRATAEARRAGGALWLGESETRVDQLAETLTELRADFPARVREARLEGLAEFAAGASHEINNPLAVIRGHAQLLLVREENPDRRRQLESIIGQTRRVHDLLHGTLQFARPPRPVSLPVSVAEWLAESVADHVPDAEAKRVTLIWDETARGDDWGQFDRVQARQALDQLIRNALEAAPPGGWVRVASRRERDTIAVVVEDSGPGPAEADENCLFDPFFSGREAGRGKGLGLAIAWRLAQVNGGDIRFAPVPGGPTRFVLTFPATLTVRERKSA